MQESCPPLRTPRPHDSREGWGVVDYRVKASKKAFRCATFSVESARDRVHRRDGRPTTPRQRLTS